MTSVAVRSDEPVHPVGVSESPSPGAGVDRRADRERFAVDELAIVLSHFEVGIIQAVQEFPRGSRKAPKLLVKTENGLYLLKRRAQGKDDPFKVAFCHDLQLFLADKKFPLPHLLGTRKGNNSMLQRGGRIYELFEYIRGTVYDQSGEATADAGKTLGLFHKLVTGYQSAYEAPTGSYHASRAVGRAVELIPETMSRQRGVGRSGECKEVLGTLEFLGQSYAQAANSVERAGLGDWPTQIVHSDWHPGNMLFRGPRVVAVIDYDAARLQQRVIDVANGALQFSIVGGGDDPDQWPEGLDERRFLAFLRGYDSVPSGSLLSHAELRVIPALMIEALIAEAVIPIAATGCFGRMNGGPFLRMVAKKVRWLQSYSEKLARALAE